MGLNETPSGERLHIGFFGKRNVGKSSLVNAVTGQAMALVSDTKGTTTDPVQKAMELLPLGPVVIIDTPGYDDEGELGLMRVARTRQVLNRVDLAVLVVEAAAGPDEQDQEMIRLFREKEIPYVIQEELGRGQGKERLGRFPAPSQDGYGLPEGTGSQAHRRDLEPVMISARPARILLSFSISRARERARLSR